MPAAAGRPDPRVIRIPGASPRHLRGAAPGNRHRLSRSQRSPANRRISGRHAACDWPGRGSCRVPPHREPPGAAAAAPLCRVRAGGSRLLSRARDGLHPPAGATMLRRTGRARGGPAHDHGCAGGTRRDSSPSPRGTAACGGRERHSRRLRGAESRLPSAHRTAHLILQPDPRHVRFGFWRTSCICRFSPS